METSYLHAPTALHKKKSLYPLNRMLFVGQSRSEEVAKQNIRFRVWNRRPGLLHDSYSAVSYVMNKVEFL